MTASQSALERPRIALVLSGGGARGAYEVGVIRYLREELPRELGDRVRFDIICGTSVGAVNACFLAATADDPAGQGKRLAEVWESLELDQVYRRKGLSGLAPILNLLNDGARDILGRRGAPDFRSLLDTAPLREMLKHKVAWERIGTHLEAGRLEALALSTTNIDTGQTIVFVQTAAGGADGAGGLPHWDSDSTVAAPAVIRAEHALASAAIPILFPSVDIDGTYYCDGGLRQNTPLSPAIHLGADKLLVIGLHHRRAAADHSRLSRARRYGGYPASGAVLGKVLNSIFLDHVDYDLGQLRRVNSFLEAGEKAFGPRFLEVLNQADLAVGDAGEALAEPRPPPPGGRRYRPIPDMFIHPSRDLGQLAARYVRNTELSQFDLGLLQRLLFRISELDTATESDLSSYLLFDGDYAAELISLGMADAHARREELIRFFES